MFDWAAACELNIKLAHIETRRAKVVIQVMAGACVFLFIFFIPVKPATSAAPAAFRLGPRLVQRSLFVENQTSELLPPIFGEELSLELLRFKTCERTHHVESLHGCRDYCEVHASDVRSAEVLDT